MQFFNNKIIFLSVLIYLTCCLLGVVECKGAGVRSGGGVRTGSPVKPKLPKLPKNKSDKDSNETSAAYPKAVQTHEYALLMFGGVGVPAAFWLL